MYRSLECGLHHPAAEEAGPRARLRLFGSRLNDAAIGGDVGLLLELDPAVADPAPLAARLARPWVAAIDNLDRAERLGWLSSADDWLSARQLRNQMTHEYIKDPTILAGALQAGHTLVPMLATASD